MKLFLDTANISEIEKGLQWGVISGVTTNPSLVAKEKASSFHEHVKKIAEIVKGPVSAEVISTKTDDMIKEARVLSALDPNIVIKIPMTKEGMSATKKLSEEGVPINVTLVFSPQQALLAALAGATYVSPFIGRLDDIGEDGVGLVYDISKLFLVHDFNTQIIAASIRHPRHVFEVAAAGAHIITLPFKVLEQMFNHPLTNIGIKKFLEDWEVYIKDHGN
ncbi:MAG TPA: fructose-6-phosphate aldolase [Acetomicrobium sp.]|uniref:fructose-6-phosphate aldolase n=1 Tax=Acetomicrobium mobile TaxID=97477 RepID=UPI0016A55854|nr:fructose-6-phosphate aldolase [Acetomicrobium mobile]NLI43533.1 fructose-6-phosphate aldolase [Synergistaceae bacterium]HOB10498.1 fructose-6-phosphate aldolase [Acetomicrobium sp.]HQA36250.1 fructose-6-phosphate aldolase [Acetomicrobium sp.]HQC88005.1 fructose-6-phosphate aldolase [Acetomicrobium sp.]